MGMGMGRGRGKGMGVGMGKGKGGGGREKEMGGEEKERKRKGKERKKEREGKEKERKGKGKGRERKGKEKGKGRKGKERKKEREGKERKGKRKGKERKGKERKGKGKPHPFPRISIVPSILFPFLHSLKALLHGCLIPTLPTDSKRAGHYTSGVPIPTASPPTEGGSTPAKTRLDHRQERLQLDCARQLTRITSAFCFMTPLPNRLRTAIGLAKATAGKVKVIAPGRGHSFPGIVVPPPGEEEKEERDSGASGEAREREGEGVLWTKPETEEVGGGMDRKHGQRGQW